MKDSTKSCNPELVSRFFDGELGQEETSQVSEHLETCPVCRESLENLRSISETVRSYMGTAREVDVGGLENKVIVEIQRKEAPWWSRAIYALFSKRVLIPAGAIASFSLIFLTVFHNPAVNGPSAIVTSLSTSGSSVIIMETSETRQTILWFNEKG